MDIWSGELRSLKEAAQVYQPTNTGTLNTIYLLDTLWLAWNEDVDVVRTPVGVGTDVRIHYTGHYNAKSTDTTLAATGGTDYPMDWYNLGLPSPDAVPDVIETGTPGTDPVVTRNYVYTFVTQWGEEGPPSTPTADATFASDSTWRIGSVTAMNTTPLNTGPLASASVAAGVVTVITSNSHFLQTGDYVYLSSLTGTGSMPADLEGGLFQVERVDATTFSFEFVTTGTLTGGTLTREAYYNTTDMTKRIYRTIAGGFYRFVAEIPAATTQYDDTVADADLGEELPSATWVNPPPDMRGLITLPNGSLCGFTDNTLHFTPAYRPWAWPADYDMSFPYPIVAIAAAGESVIVATKGNPFLVTGVDPSSMSQTELEIFQSCVSKRSMVSIMNGAQYASPDGLVYVPVAGTPEVITNGLYKESDWRELNPSSMHAYVYNDRYYAQYSGAGPLQNESGFIVYDPKEPDSSLTTLGINITAGHTDLETDSWYYLENGIIRQFNEGSTYLSFDWKSKVNTTQRPVVMQAAQIKFTAGDGVSLSDLQAALAASLAILEAQIFFPNGNPLAPDFDKQSVSGAFGGYTPGAFAVGGGPYHNVAKDYLEAGNSLVLTVYTKDGAECCTYVVADSLPFRINTGDLTDIFEYQISGKNVEVHEITIAETLSDIAQL